MAATGALALVAATPLSIQPLDHVLDGDKVHDPRLLDLGSPGNLRGGLAKEAPRRRVIVTARGHDGRARLRVPAPELPEVHAGRVRHRLHEVVAGHRLAVVAGEIQVDAAPEAVASDQGLEHPDDLGAFLVDRSRVEIVDLVIKLGPHRMGEGARIFHELMRA